MAAIAALTTPFNRRWSTEVRQPRSETVPIAASDRGD